MVCAEGGHGETNEARKPGNPTNLDGPEPKAVIVEMALDANGGLVTFLPRQSAAEKFHDGWIRVHRGERLPIVRGPMAQDEPFGSDRPLH